jgi:Spy/CpxP family protein refolding chaperone
MTQRASRIAARVFAATFALVVPLAGAPAFADQPSAWPAQPTHSFWNYLVLLILIPAAIAITITVLVLLPSLVKGDRYDPTQAWAGMRGGKSEWFGGPAKGTDQAAAPKAEGSGGASASW